MKRAKNTEVQLIIYVESDNSQLSVIETADYSSNKTEIYLIGSSQNTEIQLNSVEHHESDIFPEAEVGETFASASDYVAGSKGSFSQQLIISKRS